MSEYCWVYFGLLYFSLFLVNSSLSLLIFFSIWLILFSLKAILVVRLLADANGFYVEFSTIGFCFIGLTARGLKPLWVIIFGLTGLGLTFLGDLPLSKFYYSALAAKIEVVLILLLSVLLAATKIPFSYCFFIGVCGPC